MALQNIWGYFMSCLTPLTLYHLEDGSTTFNKEIGFNPISIPCQQCLGCRIDHSRDWALRCMHHAQSFQQSCFITLTFNKENLKDRKSVNVKDFQLFIKRFREKYPKINYFHSTEYGDKRSRPHHHAILFGYFPPDAYIWQKSGHNIYYRSPELEKFWRYQGFIVVGELTYQTAAYTASYTFKKQKGKDYPEGISPEKMTCSHYIGIDHFKKYYKDYVNLGKIIYDGKHYRIPRRYIKELEKIDPKLYIDFKQKREENSRLDDILDRERRYRKLVNNQQKYKKKYSNDVPLAEDNRYLRQLLALQIQIFNMSGEYNPDKKEKLYDGIRSL